MGDIRVRPLKKSDWPFIEELFGSRGGCGGCWCMAWRSAVPPSQYEAQKGEPNRREFQSLVTTGRAFGALAFDGRNAVGWCSVGPRADFPALGRSRVLKTDWSSGTWSVTCFLVRREYRGRGVAAALLQEAVNVARSHGATEIEGYPARTNPDKPPLPGPFVWTGVAPLFERAGFELIREPPARPVYRLRL